MTIKRMYEKRFRLPKTWIRALFSEKEEGKEIDLWGGL